MADDEESGYCASPLGCCAAPLGSYAASLRCYASLSTYPAYPSRYYALPLADQNQDTSRFLKIPENMTQFTVETRGTALPQLLVRIESFSMFSEHGIQKYESREFGAGGYKWRLIIYPDGHESVTESDHISVYLCMVWTSSLPVDWKVNATFSIFLFNQILDNYLCFHGKMQRFDAMTPIQGVPKLISKKSLMNPSNGYLVDDNCVFGAEVSEVSVIENLQVIDCVSLLKITNLYKHDLMISPFSKLEGVWTSEEFLAGGYRWKINLYPNGNGRGEGHSVSIFMECVDSKSFAPHEKVEADICIRIKNKIHDTHRSKNFSHWYTSSEFIRGFDKFIRIADMHDPSKGFVVDDCCFLETEITVHAVAGDEPKSGGDLSFPFSKLCL